MHVYEVRPRNDHRGVDLISDALPFGHLWNEDASAAVVFDAAGNVIETHEHAGEFKSGKFDFTPCNLRIPTRAVRSATSCAGGRARVFFGVYRGLPSRSDFGRRLS